MATYTITHLDTCLPDYFEGSHLPTFCIMADGNITYKQLKEQMLDWQTTGHIDSLDAGAFKEAVEELFSTVPDLSQKFDAGLDILDEDDYGCECYAFFALEGLGEPKEN